MQKLATASDLKSFGLELLDALMAKFEDSWASIPVLHKVRLTSGKAGALMNAFPLLSDSDEEKLENTAADIAGMLLIEDGSPEEWSGKSPRNTALVQLCLSVVNEAVDNAAGSSGNPDQEEAKLKEIARECDTALQARSWLVTSD